MISFSKLVMLLSAVAGVSSSIIPTLLESKQSPNGLSIRTSNEFQDVVRLFILSSCFLQLILILLQKVTWDGHSIMVHGKRVVILSGEVTFPVRSQPRLPLTNLPL